MDITTQLTASVLFRDVLPETAKLAAETGINSACRKGDTVPSGELVLVLSGTVQAVGAENGREMILNTLHPGDFFGMASLFGGACENTLFRAAADCQLLCLSQQAVEALIRVDPAFARNYITVLTGKIRFLNQKITAFTAGSAEKKLARYLLSLPAEGDAVTLPMSMVRLAAALDLGRASLYRAFDFLETQSLLTRHGSRIEFGSLAEFKKIYGGSEP